MVEKGGVACDPGGLIFEAYRIEDLSVADARTIFFDWAMGPRAVSDLKADVATLLAVYGPRHPDHPMTDVLREGLSRADAPKRRGGWRARRK